jgi:hypothetical protein
MSRRLPRCSHNRRSRHRARKVTGILERDADDGAGSEKPAGVARVYVLAPEMHSGGTRSERDIDTIIDEKGNAAAQRRQDRARGRDHMAGRGVLVPVLQQRRPTRRRGAGEVRQVVSGEPFAVENAVEADVSVRHRAPSPV